MNMTREEARIELQAMKDTFEEYEPGGSRCQMALKVALTALRPVSREQVEKVWRGEWDHKEVISNKSITGKFLLPSCECSLCGCYVQQEVNFCPHCGAAQTDEAVEMVMERLESLHDNRT